MYPTIPHIVGISCDDAATRFKIGARWRAYGESRDKRKRYGALGRGHALATVRFYVAPPRHSFPDRGASLRRTSGSLSVTRWSPPGIVGPTPCTTRIAIRGVALSHMGEFGTLGMNDAGINR